MPRRKSWDKRYPPKENTLITPGDFEAWIVGTFNKIEGYSACAWEIRRRGENQPACPPEAYRSAESDSALHRPYIASLVGVVQTLAPSSRVNFVCELEWVVNIINGEHSYNKHADIWEAYERWKEVRDIKVTATTKSANTAADKKIFADLKKLASKTRKGKA